MGTERCNFCATTMEMKDLKRCAGCKAAFYCSKECQKRHWKMAHKAICALQTKLLDQDIREDPDEKAQTKKVNRWINVWSPAMTACLPLALDLANHPWGRHKTHALVISVQHTDLNEDAQLFEVAEAAIRSCTEIIKLVPELEPAIASPSGPSEWPRLHCVIFVRDRHNPVQTERVRVHSCCAPNLRESFSHFDKDYSRAVAKQAVPLLVDEINGFKKPEEVVEKFHLMVGGPDVVRPFLDALNMPGITDGDDGGLFQQYLERLLGRGNGE